MILLDNGRCCMKAAWSAKLPMLKDANQSTSRSILPGDDLLTVFAPLLGGHDHESFVLPMPKGSAMSSSTGLKSCDMAIIPANARHRPAPAATPEFSRSMPCALHQ